MTEAIVFFYGNISSGLFSLSSDEVVKLLEISPNN